MSLEFDLRSIEDIEKQEVRRQRCERTGSPADWIIPDPELDIGV